MPTEPRQFDDWKRHAVYLRDGYKCAYSGYEDKTCTGKRLSLDHIDPIHTGGALQNKRDEPATNLTTAHGPTNFAKADRTREQWSAYAKDIAPPKAGLKFDWKDIEKGAKPPPELDMKRGEQLSKLAKQARDARRLDKNGKRTIETPKSKAISEKSQKIVAEYKAEQAAKAAGPGIHHDPEDGRFTQALVMSVRARTIPATMNTILRAYLHERAADRWIEIGTGPGLAVASAHLTVADVLRRSARPVAAGGAGEQDPGAPKGAEGEEA